METYTCMRVPNFWAPMHAFTTGDHGHQTTKHLELTEVETQLHSAHSRHRCHCFHGSFSQAVHNQALRRVTVDSPTHAGLQIGKQNYNVVEQERRMCMVGSCMVGSCTSHDTIHSTVAFQMRHECVV